MKLAEMLLARADLQKRTLSLRDRLIRTARIQQGDQPNEAPAVLLKRMEETLAALEIRVVRIQQVNMTHRLSDGRSLAQWLATRERLLRHHSSLAAILDATVSQPERYSSREIMWVTTVDVAALQDQKDALGEQIRSVNGTIQAANWAIDVE